MTYWNKETKAMDGKSLDITEKWTMPLRDWGIILNQLRV